MSELLAGTAIEALSQSAEGQTIAATMDAAFEKTSDKFWALA